MLALLLAGSHAHADVRILEQPELGSFRTIQSAIEVAADGSTLLVGPGQYSQFTVFAKSLRIVGIPSGPIRIEGTVRIEAIARGGVVSLDGLTIRGDDGYGGTPALELVSNSGAVRVHDCALAGGDGLRVGDGEWQDLFPGGDALVVESSSNVALIGCQILGGSGASTESDFCCEGGAGGHGIRAVGSALVLYESTCTGGPGGTAGYVGGGGGAGCTLMDAALFASHSTFRGGNGGDANDFIAPEAGPGGDGLWVSLASQARLLDNSYEGGAGGHTSYGDGQAGRGKHWEGGSLDEAQGTRRTLLATTDIAGDEESWELRVEGLPGDRIYLCLSRADAFRFAVQPLGVWLVGPQANPLDVTADGIVPGTGVLSLSLRVPPMAGGELGATYQLQACVVDAGGALALSGSVQLLALDQDEMPDCDANGRPDILDFIDGTGDDCDGNLEMDACQVLPDCNGNGIADGIETDCGTTPDENDNGVPDECEDGVIHVDASAPPGGDGSVTAPFRTLAEAFAAALDASVIRVHPGTYTGAQNRGLDFAGRSLDIEGLGGAALCIIDCEGVAPAFVVGAGNPPIRIADLQFLNGRSADGAGAAHLAGTAALVERCEFRACTSFGYDGGALFVSGDALIDRCTFVGNSSTHYGGAVAIGLGASVRIRRCTFELNRADWHGGAVFADFPGDLTVTHSSFRANEAGDSTHLGEGGAMYLRSGDAGCSIHECTFEANSAWGGGGALELDWGQTRITSSTFVANDGGNSPNAWQGGGALLIRGGATAVVRNSVLWANIAGRGSQARVSGSPSNLAVLDVEYCDVEHGQSGIDVTHGSLVWGNGNLDADPLLDADLRLGAGSPCIDAGDNAAQAVDDTDIDGDGDDGEPVPLDHALAPRRADDPLAPDTGSGAPPLIDLGALERR